MADFFHNCNTKPIYQSDMLFVSIVLIGIIMKTEFHNKSWFKRQFTTVLGLKIEFHRNSAPGWWRQRWPVSSHLRPPFNGNSKFFHINWKANKKKQNKVKQVERDDRAGMVDRDVSITKADLGVNRDVCVIEQINQAFTIVSAGQSSGRTHHTTVNITTNTGGHPVCPCT